jgi:hypothetical protein
LVGEELLFEGQELVLHEGDSIRGRSLDKANVPQNVSEAEHHELADAAVDYIGMRITERNSTDMFHQALDSRQGLPGDVFQAHFLANCFEVLLQIFHVVFNLLAGFLEKLLVGSMNNIRPLRPFVHNCKVFSAKVPELQSPRDPLVF